MGYCPGPLMAITWPRQTTCKLTSGTRAQGHISIPTLATLLMSILWPGLLTASTLLLARAPALPGKISHASGVHSQPFAHRELQKVQQAFYASLSFADW